MRRVVAIVLALAGVSALAVVGCGSSGGSGNYQVRAIFDNAVSVIPGEDVKIAGVNVGKVDSLDITKDAKAIVVLNITEPGFQDFRKDARCQIRPQGFIGEKFVDCTPTEPKRPGQAQAPMLDKIQRGRGKGEYLLQVTNTSTPVDLDLVNNVFRLPYAQRLSLIINELGVGLAGRGTDLSQVIRRANPALQETDKVLAVLAQQNKVLSDLTVKSDRILAPLARNRQQVAGFIAKAGNTAQATAERSAALQGGLERLPTFLRELRPTMAQLSALSDTATPTFNDLRIAAPTLNRLVTQLGPFADASLPAIESLGQASVAGSKALPAVRPIIPKLRLFADSAREPSANLNKLVTSLRDTGGVERIMDFLFYTVGATNGFDQIGRFLRVQLIANTCALYAMTPSPPSPATPTAPAANCTANFNGPKTPTAAAPATAAGETDARQRAVQKIYQGMSPEQALKEEGLQSVDQLYATGKGTGTAKDKGSAAPTDTSTRTPRAKASPAKPAGDSPIGLPDVPVLGGTRGKGAAADTTSKAPSNRRSRARARARARAAARAQQATGAGGSGAPTAQDPASQAALDQQGAQDTLFDYLLGNDR